MVSPIKGHPRAPKGSKVFSYIDDDLIIIITIVIILLLNQLLFLYRNIMVLLQDKKIASKIHNKQSMFNNKYPIPTDRERALFLSALLKYGFLIMVMGIIYLRG